MIDIRKLKELVRLMVTNDLSELDLRDEQQQVTVKRGWQPGSAGHPAGRAGRPGRGGTRRGTCGRRAARRRGARAGRR